MPNFHYYQQAGGEEAWRPVPAAALPATLAKSPVFVTVLAVSKLVEDLTYEDKLKLAYAGPLYFDWDSEDEIKVIEKVNQFLDSLEAMSVDLAMCRLYATGGRGYHLEIPMELFIHKLNRAGVIGLPAIYREMALEMCVDTLDMRVYSGGRGRMWRVPNVRRTNGRYKVPVTLEEMREMTPELCVQLTRKPRNLPAPKPPEFCPDLSISYARAQQKVEELLKRRAKFKPDPKAVEKAGGISIEMAMAGIGLKEGIGFQELSTQLAIAATTAGMKEDAFVEACAGLIASHQSDGNRYNSDAKRADELRRMHRYMDGNMCYEFSIGAIKKLLTHSAPDLDGLHVTVEEVKEVIAEAALEESTEMDEYHDVAKGISLARHGVYKDTEFGKKRICAISFANSAVLRSSESCQIVGYDTDILVNGVRAGRQMLELDVFAGLVQFNRFAARYGHAFTGTDIEVRTVMMRFVEQGKKKGSTRYVLKREGLDVVSIPHHENPMFREPFLVWADASGVVTDANIASSGLELTYQGFPDPRGVFKTDISQAPPLVDWIKEPENKAALCTMLQNLMSCQKPDLMGKLIGWYVSCFWKQLFQKVYGKFPLLHVNGAAGVGKTETNILLGSLFNYRQEVRPTSPASTVFAMQTQMTASSSIPLIIDEYKPHEMHRDLHNRMKAMFRDAYNQRDITRGGGTRESDDFRALNSTQLSSPLVFIAEAAEEEAAVMERVVLATFGRPAASTGLKNLAKFQAARQGHEMLGILGQYLAAQVVDSVTLEAFRVEFDAMYEVAKNKYMLTQADLDGDLPEEELRNKQNAKERSVYNHTVAKYGFGKFRALVNALLAGELDDLMGELEGGIYSRLADLHAATTPEHIKVLAELSSMSHHVERDRPEAIRLNFEYAFSERGGRSCIEIALRPAYQKYRQYCRSSGLQPLYSGVESLMHSVKDSPAFISFGDGTGLPVPQVYVFDVEELAKYGVDLFRSR